MCHGPSDLAFQFTRAGLGAKMEGHSPPEAGTPPAEKKKGHCPHCGGIRSAYVRGKHRVEWADPIHPVDGATTCLILECCGCETMFFRQDVYFSEDYDYDYDPRTGQPRIIANIRTTYWPAPSKRNRPEWLHGIEFKDKTLGSLLNELYSALDNDLSVLSAIGVRTSLDRASEILKVKPSLTFDEKLNALFNDGKIGADEKGVLAALVHAGSAAAHRGWSPKSNELSTMMDVLEAFLYRNFFIGEGIAKLAAAVPPRPAREPSKSKP